MPKARQVPAGLQRDGWVIIRSRGSHRTLRKGEQLTLMVARKRRGDGHELLSPLVMPARPIASALAGVLERRRARIRRTRRSP